MFHVKQTTQPTWERSRHTWNWGIHSPTTQWRIPVITMSLPESGNRRNRRCSRRDTRRWSMSAITGSLFLSPAARAAARVAQAPRPPSSADGATAVCSRSSSVPCAVLIAALAHQRGQRGAARNVLHAAQRPGADTAAKAQHSTSAAGPRLDRRHCGKIAFAKSHDHNLRPACGMR